MSYSDVARDGKELRPYSSPQQDGNDKATREVQQQLFGLSTQVTQLRRDVDRLGTAQDTVKLRQKIAEANQNTTSSAKSIGQRLNTLHAEQKTQQTGRLVSSFEATLKDLQTTLKVAKSKEAASLPKEAKHTAVPAALDLESGVNADEHQALMQQQQQQQERLVLESRLQYNDALIDERDEGIQDIQRNIQDIQEMFQDMAVLVHDQGLQIDDIDANVSTYELRTEQAGQEIVKADTYQRAARNRKCILLTIVIIVVVVLVLVIAQ